MAEEQRSGLSSMDIGLLLVLLMAAACEAGPARRNSPLVGSHTAEPVGATAALRWSRIVSGIEAERGQFKYQARLLLDGRYLCGGSLISPGWLLTAAHCAKDFTTFTAYLGATHMGVEESGRLALTSRLKIVHGDYDPRWFNNDIALINLGTSVKTTEYIEPISLASGSNDYAGSVARVSGFGRTSDDSGASDQLYYADLAIISNEKCAEFYIPQLVAPSTMCAQGQSGQSTCNGDSGGPLVDPGSDKQIGVVSFGPSTGCMRGNPVGFARVTSFAAWISANTGVSIEEASQ